MIVAYLPLCIRWKSINKLYITRSRYSGGDEILTSYYYYFYNWNVKEICSSPSLAEVEAKIGSNEDLTISK